ncbi:MAG: hypothetical protein HC924_02010 [Synechococcaceae cyanobacterium SM2_3_2]|nr:hypothetical protein [Synechococcaceae cyanobacterium SM2_3_2]
MQSLPWPQALERYSQRIPSEALRVQIRMDGEDDCVLIYKGFSSSLMRATPASADESVIPLAATLIGLERLRAPLDPLNPEVLATYQDPEAVRALLREQGMDPSGLVNV